MWKIWMQSLQGMAISINWVLTPTKRTKKTKSVLMDQVQSTIWTLIYSMCDNVGDMILKATASNNKRQRLTAALKRHRSRSRVMALAMSVLAMQADVKTDTERRVRFDTDSEWVGVDNRCSGCISHVRSDFIGNLKRCNRVIKGFGGSRTTNVKMGTIRWKWEDDQGRPHSFDIPNSYYVPEGKLRLLSPQHWSQSQTKSRKGRATCGEQTNGNECILYWNDGQNQLHIELSRVNNVASFPLAHGFEQFGAFCCEAALDNPSDDPIAMPSTIISDDEDDHDEVTAKAPLPWQSTWQPATRRQQEKFIASEIEFALNGPSTTPPGGETSTNSKEIINANTPNVIIDEEERQPQSEMAELLATHFKYGHLPMRKLQEMAKQGILPKRLAQCNLPTCSACLYAKATRKPWR
ncbi:hypothetical protein MHU86_12333 [Fragilaria crotonensis]|nr:hypothetical protein MHU86_12333 [Fragilaria crotonensis]